MANASAGRDTPAGWAVVHRRLMAALAVCFGRNDRNRYAGQALAILKRGSREASAVNESAFRAVGSSLGNLLATWLLRVHRRLGVLGRYRGLRV